MNIEERPILDQIKYRLQNMGYSVNLSSGVLCVCKETRSVSVKEVKQILPLLEKRRIVISGKSARFDYVVIEEK